MSREAPGHQPLVAIGVPVYNGERFLEATLDCLLAQTYRNIEIIVSDNASTDGTAAICKRYAQLDPCVKHARTEINVGANGNIRRLAGMFRGEYFKLSNADDLVGPEDEVLHPDVVAVGVRRAEEAAVAVAAEGDGRLAQRLRRDRARAHADAADVGLALDQRDALAELGGLDGGALAARPRSDRTADGTRQTAARR